MSATTDLLFEYRKHDQERLDALAAIEAVQAIQHDQVAAGSARAGWWTDEKVTGELVETAERNTARLRQWYDGVKWRLEHYKAGTVTDFGAFEFHATNWHEDYARRAAAKTDLSATMHQEGA